MKQTMKIICFFTVIFMGLSIAIPTLAKPVFISQQPLSYEVGYGAASTVNTGFTLPFTVVSSYGSGAFSLSSPQLVVTNTQSPPSQFSSISYTCSCSSQHNPAPSSPLPVSAANCPLYNDKGAVCQINANITSSGYSGTGPYIPSTSLTFSIQYSTGGLQATTVQPITLSFATGAASINRTFTFTNNSPQNVFIGISGGSTSAINPSDPVNGPTCCSANTDCYPGTTCVNNGTAACTSGKQCFWNNPSPSGNNYYLVNGGTSTTVTLPTYDNGILPVWSGGVTARVGCSTTNGHANSCTIADCGGTSTGANGGACNPGQGFTAPASAAEFTLQNSNALIQVACGPTACNSQPTVPTASDDTYDITIINGISIPISMGPTSDQTGAPTYDANGAPYLCGTPGSQTPVSTNNVYCSWSFTPPNSYDYVSVKKPGSIGTCPGGNGCACTSSSPTCTNSGYVCGINFDSTQAAGSQITQICGQPILDGSPNIYWTADQVCGLDPTSTTAQTLFACGTTFNDGDYPTYAQMYGCTTGNMNKSCYTSPSTTCCGCQDWSGSPTNILVLPGTKSCGGYANTTWLGVSINGTDTNAAAAVQPTLNWLKTGCPTAYVYPYDDASSTFTCQIPYDSFTASQNTANYTVTFLTP